MNSTEQEFNNYFKRSGGLLDVKSSIFSEWSDAFEWYTRRYHYYLTVMSGLPLEGEAWTQTYFNYIDSPKINAVVAKSQSLTSTKTYLVGLFAGSLVGLSYLFKILLSQREILTRYGNSKEETDWVPDLSEVDWIHNPFEGLSNLRGVPEGRFPKDPQRGKYVDFLVTFALDFLFYHEMGHITSGHLECIHSHYSLDYIDENETLIISKICEEDYKIRQLMELDADRYAGSIISGFILSSASAAFSGNPFSSRLEAIEMYVLAMGILFTIMDQSKDTALDYSRRTHPHPIIRLVQIYEIFNQEKHSNSKRLDLPDLSKIWFQSLKEIEASCGILNIPSSIWSSSERDFETALAHYEALKENWQDIRVDVLKYSRMRHYGI